MDGKKNHHHPSLPSNYVTLAQLQQRWLQQQKQQQEQQPPPQKQQQEEKQEQEQEQYQEGSHQPRQQRRGTAVRSFAGKQNRNKNHSNRPEVRGDSGTSAENKRAEAGIGVGDVDLESKGNSESKKKVKAKPKPPRVEERGTKMEEEDKEKEESSHQRQQQQSRGTAVRSFAGKQNRNDHRNRPKIRANWGTNGENQCADAGIGDVDVHLGSKGNESKKNVKAKRKPRVEERGTKMEEENKEKEEVNAEKEKTEKEEVNNAEKEKTKIESESNEEKSGGSRVEEVEQKFGDLGSRRARDGFGRSQPHRGYYGGRRYCCGYRNGYSYDGYGDRDFGGGFRRQRYEGKEKRGGTMVWVRKGDNVGGTETSF